MSTEIQRARALMQQDRYQEAIREIQKALSAAPDDAHARGMLALCLLHLGKTKEARREAEKAIAADPEDWYLHYVLAFICMEAKQSKVAETAAREALRLNPEEASLYGVLALILGARSRWGESLQVAEAGLELDPYDTNCLNARTQALSILGRREDARASVEESLSENSEESMTQGHAGWAMLRQGRVREAIDHFREGLRLDPNSDYCREGMVEALRARFPIYRLLIGFQTWLLRLPQGVRTGVLIGIYVLGRTASSVSRNSPHLRPILLPIAALYTCFVLMSWLGGPILNITLLAHPLGRIALSRDERREAAALGALILCSLIALLAGWLTGSNWPMAGGFFGLVGVIIVALLNMLERRKSKAVLICVAAYGFSALALLLAVAGFLLPSRTPG